MSESQEPNIPLNPMKDLLHQMGECFRHMRLDDAHALYLARDLEAAAHDAGIFEAHKEIGERIIELRKWIEEDWGNAPEELLGLPE
jgi:hypothetical protein